MKNGILEQTENGSPVAEERAAEALKESRQTYLIQHVLDLVSQQPHGSLTAFDRAGAGMNHQKSVLHMDATFHPVSSKRGAVVDSPETPGWSSASACRCWHLAAGIITATFSVLSGPNH